MQKLFTCRKHSFGYYVFLICGFFWIFCNLYLAFITFWPHDWPPFKTIDLHSITVENTGNIYPGDIIQYKVKCYKYIEKPGLVSMMVINDRIFIFSSFQSNIKPFNNDEVSNSLHLPITAIPGEHFLRLTVCYDDVVPFKKICKTIDSKPFRVSKK